MYFSCSLSKSKRKNETIQLERSTLFSKSCVFLANNKLAALHSIPIAATFLVDNAQSTNNQ